MRDDFQLTAMQLKNCSVCATFYRVLLTALTLLVANFEPSNAQEKALRYVSGSTQRLSQLTGDYDRAKGEPTLNLTGQRFGADATDLGSSFEHQGKLFFLFGDTWGQPGLVDAVAWSQSRDPAHIKLDFYRDTNGEWLPPIAPGVERREFEIPSGGISVGGKIHVVFTTNWPERANIMGRSILAVSDDDGRTFRALYPLSHQHFINVSLWQKDGWIYLFGSGEYRKSNVYLARTRAKNIAIASAWSYWSGKDRAGNARWSARESEAAPLFIHPTVGEFSVAYCEPIGRWLMLYNSSNPRGVVMRSALRPAGPWTDAELIFDPWRDGGYGKFMHISSQFKADADKLSDAGREAEWGGEYGPYLMARFTKALPATGLLPRGCRIFYTLSTWNPYQVMVMQSDVRFHSSHQ